jgi:hypothetical protein
VLQQKPLATCCCIALTFACGTRLIAADAADEAAQELQRIAALKGSAQVRALRTLLSNIPDEPEVLHSFWYLEDRLRPALRSLIRDPNVGEIAVGLLALIAVPQDVQFAVQNLEPPRSNKDNGWTYSVVCSSLNPRSEAQWRFLRGAALNEYDDRWADAGAIYTLKFIASDRSRRILEEVRSRNPHRERLAEEALEYVRSDPAPLSSDKLETLAERVTQIVKVGRWTGNTKPMFNAAADKALVDSVFVAESDRFTYTATYHRERRLWTLRGMRETLQQLMPAPPPPPKLPSK